MEVKFDYVYKPRRRCCLFLVQSGIVERAFNGVLFRELVSGEDLLEDLLILVSDFMYDTCRRVDMRDCCIHTRIV